MPASRLLIPLFVLTSIAFAGAAQAQLGGLKNALDKAKQAAEAVKQKMPAKPPQQPAAPATAAQNAPAQPSVAASAPASTGLGSAKAGLGASLQFTQQMYALMDLRDMPQLMDDKYIVPFVATQISKEQAAWKTLGPRDTGHGGVAESPSITYEWQTLIDTDPAFAGGPLLDVFVRTDPDWSFLDKNPKWDANANPEMKPVIEAFLFSKDKVEDRDPNFAARELAPVARKQLQLATKRIPTHFYFGEELPIWKYDFGAQAFKFDGTQQMPGKINLMLPIYDPEAKVGAKDFYDRLPADAKQRVPYVLGPALQHTMPQEENPGRPAPYGWTAQSAWKESFTSGEIPEPVVFAIDRQLRLSSVPVDVKRAEEVSKLGGVPRARVFFTAERIEPESPAAAIDRRSRTVLLAKLEKVDILDRNDALIVTLKPESFPPASAAAAALNPSAPTTAAGKKDAQCQAMAQQLAPGNPSAYQKAYQECMARQ